MEITSLISMCNVPQIQVLVFVFALYFQCLSVLTETFYSFHRETKRKQYKESNPVTFVFDIDVVLKGVLENRLVLVKEIQFTLIVLKVI